MFSQFKSLVILFVILAATPAAAETEWAVVKTSQQVNYTIDKVNWIAVKQGTVIPNKAWISTGSRGRVQLVRGKERIVMQPNTLAAIITTGVIMRKTEVVQQTGVIDLDIEKRAQPHTYVQTPFLAAVVKGTSFRVSVSGKAASVAVQRGLVQVTSFSSGQRSNIGAGQRADVDQANGMKVAGATEKPSIESVPATAARVPARGVSGLNGPDGPESADEAGRPDNRQDVARRSDDEDDDDEDDDGDGNENGRANEKAGVKGKSKSGDKGKGRSRDRGKEDGKGRSKDSAGKSEGGRGDKGNNNGRSKDSAGGKGKDNNRGDNDRGGGNGRGNGRNND